MMGSWQIGTEQVEALAVHYSSYSDLPTNMELPTAFPALPADPGPLHDAVKHGWRRVFMLLEYFFWS